MNNQFWGDERDFYKYALLRILSDGGDLAIGVCWMLTQCGRKGGGELSYLRRGELREKDCELFDFLHHWICVKGIRDVGNMSDEIIRGAKFFADEFPIQESGRREYWQKFIKNNGARALLFFDPDTGIRPDYPGNSADEYVRADEIERIARECEDSSLMIFQYFRLPLDNDQSQKRHARIMAQLQNIAGFERVCCVYRRPVAYYFLIRPKHGGRIMARLAEAVNKLKFDCGDL